MNMCILLTLFLLATFFLTRIVLVMTGRLKGPIIQMFERYGDAEPFFYPWPQFFFWMGLWLIMAQILLNSLGILLPGVGVGLLLLLAALITQRLTPQAREWQFLRILYPFWLQDLWERTTRLERRRIAYMWIRLSWKAKLYYNSSDQAFLQWADMIIIATLF